jgi:GAF domain-containing protein
VLQVCRYDYPDKISDQLLAEADRLYLETYREAPIRQLTQDIERMTAFLERIDASKRSLPIAMYDGRRSSFEPTSLYVVVRPGQASEEILDMLPQELFDSLGQAILRAGQIVLLADSQQHALELIELAPAFQRAQLAVPIVRRWPGEANIEYALYKPGVEDKVCEQSEVKADSATLNVFVPTNDVQRQSMTACA